MKFAFIFLFLSFFAINSDAKSHEVPEAYDKSLIRLNSIDKINLYVDSCAKVKGIVRFTEKDVFLVNDVIEQKFYHDYSYYSLKDNWVAYLAGKYIWDHLSAIVIPNDLAKKEMAACSQQAIVMMEVLKDRGYKVRKLGLVGHFILEVHYGDSWHIFDPNKEPLHQGIPHDSLETFLKNGYITQSYSKTESEDEVKKMFSNWEVGKVNEFPAKNARIFHVFTNIISQNFIVIICIALYVFLIVKKRINRKRINKELLKEKKVLRHKCVV